MKNQGLKHIVISELLNDGIDFEKDPFELSDVEISALSGYAKQCNYRKPKDSYFGLGGSFFIHLKKIYKSDNLIKQDLNNH